MTSSASLRLGEGNGESNPWHMIARRRGLLPLVEHYVNRCQIASCQSVASQCATIGLMGATTSSAVAGFR